MTTTTGIEAEATMFRGNPAITGPDNAGQFVSMERTWGWYDITLRAYLASEAPSYILGAYRSPEGAKLDPGGNAHSMAGNLPSADLKNAKTKQLMAEKWKGVMVPGSNWLDRVIRIWWNCCPGMSLVGGDYTSYSDGKSGLSFTDTDKRWIDPVIDHSEISPRKIDVGARREQGASANGKLPPDDPRRPPVPDPSKKSPRIKEMEEKIKKVGSSERRGPERNYLGMVIFGDPVPEASLILAGGSAVDQIHLLPVAATSISSVNLQIASQLPIFWTPSSEVSTQIAFSPPRASAQPVALSESVRQTDIPRRPVPLKSHLTANWPRSGYHGETTIT